MNSKDNKNIILDYEQVEDRLKEIIGLGVIKKEEDLGETTFGLPIHHYTLGNGKKEIVITGATHGCEIISTDFVLHLMEQLSNQEYSEGIDLNKYRIHFIPMLNPEGYLISTSAIRQIIPREMSSEEAEKLCKDYYLRYRNDDAEAIKRNKRNAELKKELEEAERQENNDEIDRLKQEIEATLPDRNPEKLKSFQQMFQEVDYTCIPEKYAGIRQRVKEILEKYPDIPKGILQIWSANANGIDPQANCEYNDVVARIMSGELGKDGQVFKNNLRYSNINSIHPGPINCGYDPESGFKLEPEIKAISDLLIELSEKGTLHSYFNYHGTGGVLYQRPMNVPDNIDISSNEIWTRTLDNFVFSNFYSRRTYKNAQDKENSRYRILTGKGNGRATSSNDIFRIKYPRDILIELSGMGGNPIGPYGDLNGNYRNLIDSNLDAFKFAIQYADVSEKISQASYQMFHDRIKDKVPEDIVQQMYSIMRTASNITMSWLERFGRQTRSEVLSQLSKRKEKHIMDR
ncbi:MAG: hypothetical protein IKG56_02805 [Clostridia bacterium]|nr:hypothetical protein [Clostridia bacterium]